MSGAAGHRRLVARILLVSAALFGVLAALSSTGTLPIDPGARHLFAIAFGICAAADFAIGLVLWSLSRNS